MNKRDRDLIHDAMKAEFRSCFEACFEAILVNLNELREQHGAGVADCCFASLAGILISSDAEHRELLELYFEQGKRVDLTSEKSPENDNEKGKPE